MSLPVYHDDPAPLRRIPSNRVQRVWSSLFEALRQNPRLPLVAIKDLAIQAFFWEDEEMGYIPRITAPITAALAVLRRALKATPRGSSRPPVPRRFASLVNQAFEPPEKITGEKLDFEESTQIPQEFSTMPDQKGSLKTILQGGIAPFTNMRPATIKLGDSVYSRKMDVFRDLASMNGTASFGFGFRFTSDIPDERKSAIMVFRHNKKGLPYTSVTETADFTTPAASASPPVELYRWVNNTTSDYVYDGVSYSPGDTIVFNAGHSIAGPVIYTANDVSNAANALTTAQTALAADPTNQTLIDAVAAAQALVDITIEDNVKTAADPAYPTLRWKHTWGYDTNTKVFPTQYSNSGSLDSVVLDANDKTKNVKTPFEHVLSGAPQFYHCALNRSDLEDMSCQLNPMMLTRQGEVDLISTLESDTNTWKNRELTRYDMRSTHQMHNRGLSKLRFGQLWLNNEHEHNQTSALWEINQLDDKLPPRGNNDTLRTVPNYTAVTQYQGAMGTSFLYNAVLKSGGVTFTCVNRGGSGCNVDVHLFKMKKKHIDMHGYASDLTWDRIAGPYEEAYIKRAHEIVTAENLRGREPVKTDIWTKPKYPLLPGSRLMNAEDTWLNRVSKTSYSIPSQGRKNINIRFPGAKYDPCDVTTIIDGGGDNPDYSPDYDEFTYFCLYSVTGEKSSAQYSTKNQTVHTFRLKTTHEVITPDDPANPQATPYSNASKAYRMNNGSVEKLFQNNNSWSYGVCPTNEFFVQHSMSPGTDVILGDNYSPFDLQIYGKYYESVAACELQPQKSKRMYVRGGLIDFSYDTHKVFEQSVIPVPDVMQVKIAPHRTIKNNLVNENGYTYGALMDQSSGPICNGGPPNQQYADSTQGKRRLEATLVE